MDDLISRQAAIDELEEHRAFYCDNTPDSFSKLPYAEKCRVNELDMAIATLINLPSAQSKRKKGEWTTHEVACLLADMFGDECACNFNGNDEWLPLVCDFAERECPDVVGVACWEQFLKHRERRKDNERI